MRSDFDFIFLTEPHCFLHDQGIAGMETACDIGMVDDRKQLFVGPTLVVAIL